MLVVSHPVKWAILGIVLNLITYDSGVPRDIGGICFLIVMVGCGHVWHLLDYSVNFAEPGTARTSFPCSGP